MKTETTKENEMMKEERFCQSCGMPMPEESLLGANADKSKNQDYCSYCYQDGKFMQDVSMEEMIDICLEHLDEFAADASAAEDASPEELEKMKTREGAREMMLEYFPQLKRWKSA